MPSGTARTAMFLSAYAPLLALFAILQSFGPGAPSLACAAVAALSVLLLRIFWISATGQPSTWLATESVQSRDSDVMSYFVTYVVPFAAAQEPDARGRVALLAFLIIIGGLYLRANLIAVNPVLLLVGVHAFAVETSEGRVVSLLTRRRFVPQHGTLSVVYISPSVVVETRREPAQRNDP